MNYISFKNKDVTHIIDCMQYDTDRTAEFMVEEDIQDENITYEIKTANEKEVKGDCAISDDNVISFLIPENVTASPGIYKGQLISRDSAGSSAQISSFPFLVSVEKAVHDQDDPYGEEKIKPESDDRRDSPDNGRFQNKLCKRYCLKATGNLWNKDKDLW